MRLPWLILLALPFAAGGGARAQEPASSATAVNAPGRVQRLLRGLNGSLTLFGVHDAGTGWATAVEPSVSYNFNDTFSLDVTIPVYMFRLSQNQATAPKPNQLLLGHRGELGDTIVTVHAQLPIKNWLQYEATVSGTVPTGDSLNGLSTGRATFDLSNLFEHTFRRATPNLELGVGDSTTLTNPLVTKNYTSLGPLAHFQIGASFPLPFGASFQTDVYELLPIGDQKIYESVTKKGKTTYLVTGHNVTEDNGFTNALDLPIDPHTTLSAYYSRSLRLHDDIVSIGISYALRGARPEKPDDDIVLRTIQQQAAAPAEHQPPAPVDELPPPA